MSKTRFTSRFGGVSSAPYDQFNLALHVGDDVKSVSRNRELLAESLEMQVEQLIFMEQVHGRQVRVISDSAAPPQPPIADALFTMNPDVALVVLTADCIPLLLISDTAIAAVHVGRKGLVAGIIEETVATFNRFGILNSDIQAELGPAICSDCYEVELEMYRDVVKKLPATMTNEEVHRLNIAGGALEILNGFGIESTSSSVCTAHTPEYFSYRRSGRTGRQCGVIRL